MSSSGNRRGPRRPPPGTLERAVIGAAAYATWLTPADNATVWLTRDVVAQIDRANRANLTHLPGMEATAGGADPELYARADQLLRQLGLTPAARARIGLDEEIDDGLAEIHALATPAAGNGEN